MSSPPRDYLLLAVADEAPVHDVLHRSCCDAVALVLGGGRHNIPRHPGMIAGPSSHRHILLPSNLLPGRSHHAYRDADHVAPECDYSHEAD